MSRLQSRMKARTPAVKSKWALHSRVFPSVDTRLMSRRRWRWEISEAAWQRTSHNRASFYVSHKTKIKKVQGTSVPNTMMPRKEKLPQSLSVFKVGRFKKTKTQFVHLVTSITSVPLFLILFESIRDVCTWFLQKKYNLWSLTSWRRVIMEDDTARCHHIKLTYY